MKLSRPRWLLILLAAVLLIIPVLAQDATPVPTAEVTAEPTSEATVEVPDATAEPTSEATVEIPTATIEPTVATVEAPTVEATIANAEPTIATVEAPDATAEATIEPPEITFPENSIVTGLNYPRGLAYDEAGNLWIVEAGSGGDRLLAEVDGAQITGGLTGQVTILNADGTAAPAPVLSNFASAYVPMEGASLGLQRAIPTGDSVWLVLSDMQNMTVFSDAVVEVDIATGRVVNYIDLYLYEAQNNPDGTAEIYSNPSDVAPGPDGNLYIVDTGANALYRVGMNGYLRTVQAWPDNPVPTSIAFADDGSFYIGFLGQQIAPGAGAIEHWAADSKTLLETYSGLTAVTDVLVAENGDLYAVQLYTEGGDQGPNPQSGSVVRVSLDEVVTVADGLMTPFGLAEAPDGSLVVSTSTAFALPGSGAVVRIPLNQ